MCVVMDIIKNRVGGAYLPVHTHQRVLTHASTDEQVELSQLLEEVMKTSLGVKMLLLSLDKISQQILPDSLSWEDLEEEVCMPNTTCTCDALRTFTGHMYMHLRRSHDVLLSLGR